MGNLIEIRRAANSFNLLCLISKLEDSSFEQENAEYSIILSKRLAKLNQNDVYSALTKISDRYSDINASCLIGQEGDLVKLTVITVVSTSSADDVRDMINLIKEVGSAIIILEAKATKEEVHKKNSNMEESRRDKINKINSSIEELLTEAKELSLLVMNRKCSLVDYNELCKTKANVSLLNSSQKIYNDKINDVVDEYYYLISDDFVNEVNKNMAITPDTDRMMSYADAEMAMFKRRLTEYVRLVADTHSDLKSALLDEGKRHQGKSKNQLALDELKKYKLELSNSTTSTQRLIFVIAECYDLQIQRSLLIFAKPEGT